MSDLVSLIAKRGTIKSRITRFENYLRDPNNHADKIIIARKLQSLEGIIDQINELHTSIVIVDATLEDESEIQCGDIEDRYYQAVQIAEKILECQSGNSQGNTEVNIRLPVLDLPKFSGCFNDWLKFHDTFKSLIHDNLNLNNIQKFHYLNSCIIGDAATVIKSLEVSNSNYDVAWELLKERFNNKRVIIRSHVKAIFNLEYILKESHIALRTLIDSFKTHIRALANLDQPTKHWDTLMIYILSNKLDNNTKRDWEKVSTASNLTKTDDLIEYLTQKCILLETVQSNLSSSPIQKHQRIDNIVKSNQRVSHHVTNTYDCLFCQKSHMIYNCGQFLNLTVQDRIKEVKRLKLCLNCLRKGHIAHECKSSKCKHCQRAHNSLLHLVNESVQGKITNAAMAQSDMQSNSNSLQTQAIHVSNAQSQILLSTALVQIKDNKGNLHLCRALLDNGSQSNFISENFCSKLNLRIGQANISIAGVGQHVSTINQSIDINLFSRSSSFNCDIHCLVLPKITQRLPNVSFDSQLLNIPKNLFLADPSFHESKEIDLLIGSEIFWQLLCIGQIALGRNLPIVQKTKLGWIVSGPLNFSRQSISHSYHIAQLDNNKNLDDCVAKFWEIEEVGSNKFLSAEEQHCEFHFTENLSRDDSGRFIVKIPFNDNIKQLGDTKQMALKRFYAVERKLERDADLKGQYHAFMQEYLDLGHMSEITSYEEPNNSYFLPHHSVLKSSSLTTKLRVVFDGSAKSSSGLSLNDCMRVGPVLQPDLFSILLRFRQYPIALTADVTKMYRQVRIHESERCYQQIFWRFNPNQPVKIYSLNTVTYGTAAASFLAIRSLQQTAHDSRNEFPIVSDTILNSFYVDDLISGASTVEDAISLQRNISQILRSGGFELRKWASNDSRVIADIPRESESSVLSFSEDNNLSTLGLQWNFYFDTLQYNTKQISCEKRVTKRIILSCISQIFDPLGLLSPVIITAKLIMQALWQIEASWDETVPQSILNLWTQFYLSIQSLNSLKIPRFTLIQNYISIELHGFSDASERAYGACIYLRSRDFEGNTICRLLCAKSRVAPLKTISIPRLELCGALISAQLTQKVKETLNLKIDRTYLYTDSTIVLGWIKSSPSQLNTFVANRISKIQTLTTQSNWFHVGSLENPADLVSRGVQVENILHNTFWWQGPNWLSTKTLELPPQIKYNCIELPETKRSVNVHISNVNNFDVYNKFSNFCKLQRVFAYILRFINNCKVKGVDRPKHLSLSAVEISDGKKRLIRLAQLEEFRNEIHCLVKNKDIPSNSKIISLNPFLDEDNIVRVGGRINNSTYHYDKKHPILLPQKHVLTRLIMQHYHDRLMHVGPQTLLFNVREYYWPICGKNTAKQIVQNCIRCFRTKPLSIEPIMGSLPQDRITPSRPFTHCGVDYAGPFAIRDRKLRNCKLIKSYVCLFVCFITKAVHVELVTDLSTECFLAALRRFCSRRGKCQKIYSDNGTNFVGANRELCELSDFLNKNVSNISHSLASENIEWVFIPPRSPHMGGLWEAGVKSVKTHLKRVIGNAHLTYEEFYTVLVQIEGCLNSRPISPLSNNPHDLNPLTPGHFLIGGPLSSLPDTELLDVKESRLSRYQRCQQLVQHFWKRWSVEYIHTLQQRNKWQTSPNKVICIGDLVLLREENIQPLNWKMGRVVETHPGADNTIRVVSVKTSFGTIKRALNKLAILPINNN